MKDKFSLERLRNDIGWKLANQDRFRFIPFRKQIGERLQSQKAKNAMKEFGDHMDSAFASFNTHTAAVSALSDSAKMWLTKEEYEHVPGSALTVMDGLQTMIYISGGYEAVADFFDRYIVDRATFRDSMIFWMRLPIDLSQRNWMTDGQWAAHVLADPEGYQGIISLHIANEWARVLVRSAPGRWDLDDVINYLKAH